MTPDLLRTGFSRIIRVGVRLQADRSVGAKPEASGQYTFAETDGLREYRLKGKGISKFAGKRVELVGGTTGNGVSIQTGLWPAPSGGARGVARDPAQETVARQPGGGATGGQVQEFRVTRVRALKGTCWQIPSEGGGHCDAARVAASARAFCRASASSGKPASARAQRSRKR